MFCAAALQCTTVVLTRESGKTMAKTKTTHREADMYPLLRSWLEGNGYTVNAEVNGCDIAARKGGGLVVIEMKLCVNLDLLLQVAKRQELADSVYAAVLAPKARDRRWRGLLKLLRRLEAGLVLVYIDSAVPRVEVEFHPAECPKRKNRIGERALLREMDGRTLELNVGGTVRQRRVTAYRESVLLVAAGLERLGPTTPKALRELGAGEKAGQILCANHYGWFERLKKGVYGLTPAGREGLREYAALVERLRERLLSKTALAPDPASA